MFRRRRCHKKTGKHKIKPPNPYFCPVFTPGVRYMLLGTLSFALMQVFVKALSDLPVHEVVLFRAVFIVLFTYAWLVKSKIPPLGNNKKLLLLRSTIGAVAFYLFFFTLQKVPLATAITIGHLGPVFTTILAWLLLKERIKPIQWFFFALAFVGVMVVEGADFRVKPIFLIAGIVAAFLSGLVYTLIRQLRHTEHPWVVVFYFPIMAIPFSLAYCFVEWKTPNALQWFYLFCMALTSQFGQMGFTMALQTEKANTVASLQYLSVLYAIVLGYLIFGETHPPMALLGMSMVVAGVVLNVKKPGSED